jgi:hypothetical protein
MAAAGLDGSNLPGDAGAVVSVSCHFFCHLVGVCDASDIKVGVSRFE